MNERLYPPRTHSRFYILSALREELHTVARDSMPHGRAVLVDFGAGTSPYRAMFEPHVARYVCIDLPERTAADGDVLPFGHESLQEESADIVLSTQVLEHVPDVRACLRECRRLLKPDGRVILSTHGHWPYHPDPADYWRWTRAGLEKTLEDGGFRIVRLRGLMGLAPTGLQFLQDALVAKLTRRLRPAFCLLMQAAIAILDRLHSQDERDRDACVFVVVAAKRLPGA